MRNEQTCSGMSHQGYQRNLPHWQPENGVFAITFRLWGTIPMAVFLELKERSSGPELEAILKARFPAFYSFYRDGLSTPKWLADPKVADIVQEALHFRDGEMFRLIAYCIMPTHVHMVVDRVDGVLFRVMQSLKRHTAREANCRLQRTGRPFWHRESYDHVIRDYRDMCNQLRYLIDNPVKSGLVSEWSEFPYTYVRPGFEVYL